MRTANVVLVVLETLKDVDVIGHKKTADPKVGCLKCREDRVRTCDPLVPNQVRYRTALLPYFTLTGRKYRPIQSILER